MSRTETKREGKGRKGKERRDDHPEGNQGRVKDRRYFGYAYACLTHSHTHTLAHTHSHAIRREAEARESWGLMAAGDGEQREPCVRAREDYRCA